MSDVTCVRKFRWFSPDELTLSDGREIRIGTCGELWYWPSCEWVTPKEEHGVKAIMAKQYEREQVAKRRKSWGASK